MAKSSPLALVREGGFSAHMRAERARRQLTQADVAGILGVKTQTVSQWELGRKEPQPRFHASIADFLQLRHPSDVKDLLHPVPPEAKLVSTTSRPRAPGAPPWEDRPEPSSRRSVEDEVRQTVRNYIERVDRLTAAEAELLTALLNGPR